MIVREFVLSFILSELTKPIINEIKTFPFGGKYNNDLRMKNVLIVILFFVSFQGFAQEKSILRQPKVDKRVELLSLVFRLAERPEYSTKHFELYADRIENYFGKYKDHELIQFTKSIMDKNGIAYDAVMSMAIHLDENLNLLPGLTDNSLDSRWKKEDGDKFISLLKKFTKDTEYDKFYNDNTDLYVEASKRFRPIFENVDLKWYTLFYGQKTTETFVIINGLGNGRNNYGPSLKYNDGRKDVYAIMGAWRADSIGMPEFRMNECFPTLIHEFNHSFVNNLIGKNREELRNSGVKLFAIVKDEMAIQAYGNWETMMCEALVRASVIKYMKDHNFDKPEIKNEINRQMERGFLWIKELVAELDNYDKQRNLYPTLEDYMPKLADAYKNYAEVLRKFETKRPKVISINEFANGDMNVDAAIKTITVNFNKPLFGKGYSIFFGKKGMEALPKIGSITYANDNKTVLIAVELEEDKEYQFIMKGKNFKSVDGVGIKDYEVSFKTGKSF